MQEYIIMDHIIKAKEAWTDNTKTTKHVYVVKIVFVKRK